MGDGVGERFEVLVRPPQVGGALCDAGFELGAERPNLSFGVALREIGDGKLSPGDLHEDLIHALQKHVEVDEPEAEAAPPMVNPNAQAQIELGVEAQFDRMTEEDLLRGLEGLAPPPEPEEETE